METQKIGVFAFLLSYVTKILRLTDALTAGKIVILAFSILFFVFFETFVRVLFESSSNQLRKKGTFCEQNSSLTAT